MFFVGFFFSFLFLGRSAKSLNVLKTKLHSSFKKKCSQTGQKVWCEAPEHLDSGTDSPGSCLRVPQHPQTENEGMNKTCIQALTHTHPGSQTLWHFSPSEIIQGRKNPNNYPRENYFVLYKFWYRKGIYVQAKCLFMQLELSFCRQVLKQ